MAPVIGVTPDEGRTNERPGRPSVARFELKTAYVEAVVRAGGVPLVLPYVEDPAAIARQLALVDGVVVSGGGFDVPPEEYGEVAKPGLGTVNPRRTRYERRLLEAALAAGVPVLGVCGGMQLLNVVRGGSLVQDLPTEVPSARDHQQKTDPAGPDHVVVIEDDSLLSRLCGPDPLPVNTTHHQAVARVGAGLKVSARTDDGVVEAIEGPGAFELGVQWHPEALLESRNQGIFAGFVRAAEAFAARRAAR